MASATVQGGQKFPESTVLAAYPAAPWQAKGVPSPEGAPLGSSAGAATVTNGVALFTGLAAKTRYYAYALVSSEHRYVQFTTSDLTVAGEAMRPYDKDDGQAGIYTPTMANMTPGALAVSANFGRIGRFTVSRPMTITSIAFAVTAVTIGDTADPAVDVGIYSAAVARLVSSGATAGKLQATGVKSVAITPTLLLPRTVYYSGLSVGALGTTTVSIMGWSPGSLFAAQLFGATAGLVEVDGSATRHPLPDPWGSLSGASGAAFQLALKE